MRARLDPVRHPDPAVLDRGAERRDGRCLRSGRAPSLKRPRRELRRSRPRPAGTIPSAKATGWSFHRSIATCCSPPRVRRGGRLRRPRLRTTTAAHLAAARSARAANQPPSVSGDHSFAQQHRDADRSLLRRRCHLLSADLPRHIARRIVPDRRRILGVQFAGPRRPEQRRVPGEQLPPVRHRRLGVADHHGLRRQLQHAPGRGGRGRAADIRSGRAGRPDHTDLYFSTQDNSLWASSDGGATWPPGREFCCEGFFFQMLHATQSHATSFLTFRDGAPFQQLRQRPAL